MPKYQIDCRDDDLEVHDIESSEHEDDISAEYDDSGETEFSRDVIRSAVVDELEFLDALDKLMEKLKSKYQKKINAENVRSLVERYGEDPGIRRVIVEAVDDFPFSKDQIEQDRALERIDITLRFYGYLVKHYRDIPDTENLAKFVYRNFSVVKPMLSILTTAHEFNGYVRSMDFVSMVKVIRITSDVRDKVFREVFYVSSYEEDEIMFCGMETIFNFLLNTSGFGNPISSEVEARLKSRLKEWLEGVFDPKKNRGPGLLEVAQKNRGFTYFLAILGFISICLNTLLKTHRSQDEKPEVRVTYVRYGPESLESLVNRECIDSVYRPFEGQENLARLETAENRLEYALALLGLERNVYVDPDHIIFCDLCCGQAGIYVGSWPGEGWIVLDEVLDNDTVLLHELAHLYQYPDVPHWLKESSADWVTANDTYLVARAWRNFVVRRIIVEGELDTDGYLYLARQAYVAESLREFDTDDLSRILGDIPDREIVLSMLRGDTLPDLRRHTLRLLTESDYRDFWRFELGLEAEEIERMMSY